MKLSDDVIINVGALLVALLALVVAALGHVFAPPAANLASVDSIATTLASGCIGFVGRGMLRQAAPPAP